MAGKGKKAGEGQTNTLELPADVAAAVFMAATNGTGYFNTQGSEHATRLGDGEVSVELQDGKDRKTVILKVPQSVTFTVADE